jgi:hypothetical protein
MFVITLPVAVVDAVSLYVKSLVEEDAEARKLGKKIKKTLRE